MSREFTVSLYLKASNMISPAVERVDQQLRRLQSTMRTTMQSGSNRNPFDKWAKSADAAYKKVSDLQKKVDKLVHSGFKDVAFGTALVLPFEKALEKASELQTKLTTLHLGGVSSQGVKSLDKEAEALSQKTIFGKKQVIDIELSLKQAGLNERKIKNVLQTSTYLAELENQRNGADGPTTAKEFAQMAEQSGLTMVTADQRKKYHLDTQKKEDSFITKRLNQYAESINKVATVTSADIGTLFESSKYFNLVARLQGVKTEDAMMTQGLAARFGLEGSVGGVHLKDFYTRLNPYEWLGHGKTGISQQLFAMDELGFLKNAKWSYTKMGRKRYESIDGDVFHNKDGTTKAPTVIFGELAKAYDKFKDKPHGLQTFESGLKSIFGEQGRDIAAAVAINHEAMGQLEKDSKKVKPIEEGIKEYQKTFHQKLTAFQSQMSNVGAKAGTPLLDDATKLLATINPLIGKFGQWIDKHQTLVSWIGRAAAGLAAFSIGVGAAKLALGGIGHLIINPLKSLLGVNKGVANGAKGIWNKMFGRNRNNPTGNTSRLNRSSSMVIRATTVYLRGNIMGGGSGGSLGGRRYRLNRGSRRAGGDVDVLPPRRSRNNRTRRRQNSDTRSGSRSRLTRNLRNGTRELEEVGRLGKLAKFAKGLGVAGAIASVGTASYQMYQATKEKGFKQAVSSQGGSVTGSTVGGVAGGLLGSLLGPLGTAAGAAAGSWLGEKAGSYLDKKGITKSVVDSITSMSKKIKGWWTGEDAKKSQTDMKNVGVKTDQTSVVVRKFGQTNVQTANLTKQQISMLASVLGKSTDDTKKAINSIGSISGNGQAWGTVLMAGLISGMDGKMSSLKSKIEQIKSLVNGANSASNSVVYPTKLAPSPTPAPKKNIVYPTNLPFINGSHANGLSYVPFDGYIAELHKGEQVLTAKEAAARRKTPLLGAARKQQVASHTSVGTIIIQATNVDEAQVGVERALGLDQKYIASRGRVKPIWE